MIGVPFEDNDLWCLGHITEIVANLVKERPPWLVDMAARFSTTEALATWIRGLPQRDDEGLPDDGPRVIACEPTQRLRLPAENPNCVERASLYLAVGELIDPWPVRRLATLDFAWGRHTFPIEEGEPIVLDPRVTEADLMPAVPTRRGRMRHGAIWPIRRAPVRFDPPSPALIESPPIEPLPVMPVEPSPVMSFAPAAVPMPPGGVPARAAPIAAMPPMMPPAIAPGAGPFAPGMPVAIDISEAIEYTSQLAQLGAQTVRNGPSRALRARNAIHDLVETGKPPADSDTVNAMGWFLATAEQVAHGYGVRALTIVRTTAHAIAELVDDILAARQRNLSFEIGGESFAIPSWLTNLGSMAGKIGLNLGAAYVAPKLTALGITGPMIDLVEQELNAEGFTLGPIAKPNRSFTSALNSLAKRNG